MEGRSAEGRKLQKKLRNLGNVRRKDRNGRKCAIKDKKMKGSALGSKKERINLEGRMK